MIVIRRNITPMLPHLEDILSDKEKAQYHKERFYVMATNNNTLSKKEEIIKLYRQRGETSENKIKEFKMVSIWTIFHQEILYLMLYTFK